MSKVTAKGKRTEYSKPTEMYMKWEYITPAQATVLLTKNLHNRPMNKEYVERLANDMVAGHFLEHHQSLAITKEGWLDDGQHRASAVIRAQQIDPSFRGVYMWVCYNVPHESMFVIDSHKKRSFKDHMVVQESKLSATHGTVAGILLGKGFGGKYVATVPEKLDAIKKHKQAIDFAVSLGITPAVVTAVVARAYEEDPNRRERLIAFGKVYKFGRARSERDWAATTLRDFIRTKHVYGSSDRVRFYIAAELAVSAFLDGAPLYNIKIHDDFKERFPFCDEPVKIYKVAVSKRTEFVVEAKKSK